MKKINLDVFESLTNENSKQILGGYMNATTNDTKSKDDRGCTDTCGDTKVIDASGNEHTKDDPKKDWECPKESMIARNTYQILAYN